MFSIEANHTEALKAHFTRFGLHGDAIVWLLDLWKCIQCFDDVADGDIVERKDLDSTLWAVFIGMPSNPFYQANHTALSSVLATSLLKWKASDEAERAGRADAKSFVWRAGYYDVVLLVYAICHGHEKAMRDAETILGLYGENYAEYRQEFNHA